MPGTALTILTPAAPPTDSADAPRPAPPRLQAVEPASITPDSGSLPHPNEWTARMARALIEAVAGERPVSQLRTWTSREVLVEVTARAAAARRHPAGKALAAPLRKVGSVRTCLVAPGIVEACAVVSGMARARAIALRLEVQGQRWIVTAMVLG